MFVGCSGCDDTNTLHSKKMESALPAQDAAAFIQDIFLFMKL